MITGVVSGCPTRAGQPRLINDLDPAFGARGVPGDRPGLWGGLSCSRGSVHSLHDKRDVHTVDGDHVH